MFLSSKTPLVAVDIGSHSIKLAQLAKLRNGFELMKLGVMPLQENWVVDGVIREEEEVVETLTEMLKTVEVDTKYAVASVSGEAVIVKRIKMPKMSETELSESIAQEAEQHIPFDINDVVIDYQVLPPEERNGKSKDSNNNEKMDVLLVAVQREIIDKRIELLLDSGLKPAIIDLDVFALSNAASQAVDLKKMGPVAIIDMGDSFTRVHIVQQGVTAYTRDIPAGGGICTQKLMSKLKVPYRKAPDIKAGNIPNKAKPEDVVQIIIESQKKIIDELRRSFELFNSSSKPSVEKVFLTGGGVLTNGLDGWLSEELKIPVEILNPMNGIKVNSRNFDKDTLEELAPLTTVAVGLATRRFDY